MLEKTVEFDLRKWLTYNQNVVQPYVHALLQKIISPLSLDQILWRGGFGRIEDVQRVLHTGSDYENQLLINDIPGVYAVPTGRVGREPWCRGLDPLYWALRGRGHGADDGWNIVNVLVGYHRDEMKEYPMSDLVTFKKGEPTTEAVATVITLDLKGKELKRG